MRNLTLMNAINSVMTATTGGLSQVGLTVMSTNGTYSWSPAIITGLEIEQNYANNYSDDIVLTATIATADYVGLYQNVQNLMGVLTIYPLTSQGSKNLNTPPKQIQYRASLVDAKDPTKQVTDAHLRTTFDSSVKIRLTEKDLYNIRKIGASGIYQTATPGAVCQHLAQLFGISKLQMTPPDNVHVYDHIVLPPLKDFSSIFSWVQAKYGVYMMGLNYYYTSSCLFIYPPFNTNPTYPQTLTVYQAEQGSFAGASCFHTQTGNNVSLVTNTIPPTQDLSQSAAENIGTAKMFLRGSQLVDGVVTSDSSGNAIFSPTPSALSVRLNANKSIDSSGQNSQYATATDNIFALSSELSSHQALMIDVTWPHAQPYLILPGQAVKYYSDNQGKTDLRTGIVEAVHYHYQRGPRTSVGDTHLCKGTVRLRLQPIATTVTTISTT